MIDIFLCAGEPNPNDIRLSDPRVPCVRPGSPIVVGGFGGGRPRGGLTKGRIRELIEIENEEDLELVEVLTMWLSRN